MQAAVAALRAAYARDGYAGVQVGVPEQQLAAGTVRLQVVEPRLGTVRIEGQRHGDGASVRHALPSLQEGSTPNARRLARELRLANENPARRLAVDLQPADPERLDAVVTVQDEKPWKIGLVLADSGTPETGRARLGGFFQHADVAGLGHVATLQYVTSPEHVSKVTIAALNYRAPLPALGDALDFYAVHADVDSGTVNALFDVRGRGNVAGLRYTLNLPGAGEFRHRWVFGFERRHVDNRVGLTGGTPDLVPDVTLRPASVGYAASWRDELRVVDGSLVFYRNLPSGRDGNAAAIEAARSGARAGYAIWRYAATAVHTLPASWQLKLALEGQHTRDALVSGEQFGLGGQDSVRGFQERELSGDRGQRVTLDPVSYTHLTLPTNREV